MSDEHNPTHEVAPVKPSGASPEVPRPNAPDQTSPGPGSHPKEAEATPRLTVVIPTLNARDSLPVLFKSMENSRLSLDVILVDGGSTDGTPRIAEALGARIITAPAGRGHQLRLGGASATAPWILFLHADSRLQLGWDVVAKAFLANEDNRFKAAYFQLILDDTAKAARRVEDLANWRARTFGLPYGDQGLLIGKEFYDHLGGYPDQPLMEDVTLARRIGAQRLHALESALVTSAARYRRDGYWIRPLKNLSLLALYFLGASPRWLATLYR